MWNWKYIRTIINILIKDIRTIMSLLCNKRPNIDYERASTLRGGVDSSYSCVLANLPRRKHGNYLYLSSGEMSRSDREGSTSMDSCVTPENDSKHNVPFPTGVLHFTFTLVGVTTVLEVELKGWGTTREGATHA